MMTYDLADQILGGIMHTIMLLNNARLDDQRKTVIIMTQGAVDVLKEKWMKYFDAKRIGEEFLSSPRCFGRRVKILPGDEIRVWVSPVQLEFDAH